MNRVIKFRAWDIENKKMIYDFANFSSGNVIDVPEGRWSHELRLTNKNEIKASLNFKSNDTFETKHIEYIPTMQFTGLKDKNGVDIYEGDIIRIIDEGEVNIGWGWNEEVIFHIGCFMAGDDNLLENVAFRSVVLGNKFENPEWLEV